jgi:hypothetical protein
MPEHSNRLPLVILEFELENDDVNPLYPPQPESSLLGSPASTSTGSGSTFTGISLDSHTRSLRTDSDMTVQSADGTSTPPEIHGLDGDHEWQPSPQDVLESTTSRSKPLRALQRLRKSEASHNPTDTNPSPSPVRRRARAKRSASADTVNVMDVFAVMSQINEQFGNAPDLGTFMNVVVGIIKELTQFHRVLVYQFDEAWNGLVTAELVDWSKTHDLFKGLQFPASDIPPQVGTSIQIHVT